MCVGGWENNFDLSCPDPSQKRVALGIDANWRHLVDDDGLDRCLGLVKMFEAMI